MTTDQTPIKTVGVLIFSADQKQVLLVKHGAKAQHLTDTYGLPAGRPERGESEIDAAARELNEETGLTVKIEDLRPLPNIYSALIKRKNGEQLTSFRIFRCTKYSGELKSNLETEPHWVALDDLSKLNLLPNVQRIIDEARI